MNVTAQKDVIEYAHTIEERQVLEGAGNSQRRDIVWRQARDVPAVQQNMSTLWRIKSGDCVGEGGLAASVGADKAEYLAALDPHIDSVQRDNAAKASLDRPAFEYWGVAAAILEGQLESRLKVNLLRTLSVSKSNVC